ncbi:hypothetical protein F5Y09DRAFT_356990 [Xylaria sp. FL1042]|nr:hypothetical protein F5Y09DRAFT_356990 [Xylaria sp. FL1042]
MLANTLSDDGTNTSAGVVPNPHNPLTLQTMPPEILTNISYQMDPEEKLVMAFNFPELFMNSGRFHVFIDDAHYQLNIPTWIPVEYEAELCRRPLFQYVIAYHYSLDQVRQVLGFYQEVASRRQFNPYVFINCDFPDNSPQNLQPLAPRPQSPMTDLSDSPESEETEILEVHRRNILGPLHVAIGYQRLDVIRYLIEQGANVHQSLWGEFSPLQQALRLVGRWEEHFTKFDQERNAGYESIARELLNHHPTLSAYEEGTQEMTYEFELALMGRLERIVLLLLERAEDENDGLDDQAKQLRQASRVVMLDRMLMFQLSMPQALRYILEHGARYTHTMTFITGAYGSITDAALANRVIENALVAFRWEIETRDATLPASVAAITALTTLDYNIDMIQSFTQVAVELNYLEAQQRFLLNAMHAGSNAPKTRQWLLENTNAADAVALRYAILLFDKTSTTFIIHRLIQLWKDVDEPLPYDSHHSPAPPPDGSSGYWFQTALTFALATQNYDAAAQLLSVGASPAAVPPNIRHRVRVLRDRINAGMDDPAFFVYGGVVTPDGSEPDRVEAGHILSYVFLCMLDDHDFPLPAYDRHQTRRRQDLPADHPENDSSDNDDDL